MHRRTHTLLLVGCTLLVGCGETEPEFTEIVRVDEVLSRASVTQFLRIAEAQTEGRIAAMDSVFAPLPNWDRTRTLPVAELLRDERHSLESRWDIGWLVKRKKPTRRLRRTLLRERLTHEQYIALSLSIGAALRRATLREDQNLESLIETGYARCRDLESDQRPFASLTPDVQYRMLQQAAWLVRAHRADRLDDVPPENVELVAEFRDRLVPFFPPEFTQNPFDSIIDPLEEYGIPFHDPDDDDRIEWSAAGAIVGHDDPDPEFRVFSNDPNGPERLLQRRSPRAERLPSLDTASE